MPEDSQSGEAPQEEAASTAAELRSAQGAPRSQGSVFGNLPDARPGTRSPRRDSDKESAPPRKPRTARAKATKAAAEGTAGTPKAAKPKPEPSPPPGQAADAPQPPPPGARADGIAGIEDLAWAGVAAAAEAATLGVRLAGRALDALRGNAERD